MHERNRAEFAIYTGLGDIELVTKGYAAADYERHLIIDTRSPNASGDGVQLFFSLVGIFVFLRFGLSSAGHGRWVRTSIRLADQAGDRGMQLNAHGSLARTSSG